MFLAFFPLHLAELQVSSLESGNLFPRFHCHSIPVVYKVLRVDVNLCKLHQTIASYLTATVLLLASPAKLLEATSLLAGATRGYRPGDLVTWLPKLPRLPGATYQSHFFLMQRLPVARDPYNRRDGRGEQPNDGVVQRGATGNVLEAPATWECAKSGEATPRNPHLLFHMACLNGSYRGAQRGIIACCDSSYPSRDDITPSTSIAEVRFCILHNAAGAWYGRAVFPEAQARVSEAINSKS
ncbi:hypothetical protein B0H17DRAFT_1147123 [Mycena rosella]|uniref:Uncharacterized protein n=1 Tax=Mycena rosella TaxID=1033263 RepID=A0AAD7CN42_MYCRO|nr:hypothetical protein B0H17DRAFT_1147123 [Mycena rosella]